MYSTRLFIGYPNLIILLFTFRTNEQIHQKYCNQRTKITNIAEKMQINRGKIEKPETANQKSGKKTPR